MYCHSARSKQEVFDLSGLKLNFHIPLTNNMGFTDFKFKFPLTEATSTATAAREISYPRKQSFSSMSVPMARKTGKPEHKFKSYRLRGEYAA